MEALENEPETSQANLAAKVGVAVGTVNWYIKRWSAKGYVKVKRIGRWRWRYLLTPQGMAEKADLANRYFQASMRIYRQTRTDAKKILEQVKAADYDSVVIDGDGDLAEICRLTCLEQGIRVASEKSRRLPTMVIEGLDLRLELPEQIGDDGVVG
jgi:DNA-binding MarR family transcriptional regulator